MSPVTPTQTAGAMRSPEGAKTAPVEEPLGAVVALAQLLVLNLCVVGVALALLQGSRGIEGALALAGVVLLTPLLVRRLLRARK
jgi:hypothetical protein